MTSHSLLSSLTLVLAIALSASAPPTRGEAVGPVQVLGTMKRVADWQLAQTNRHAPDDWTYGALYAGMMALSHVADTQKYHDAMMAMGQKQGWKPARRVYHGDDHCVSQTYLELYFQHRDPAMLLPTQERFNYILTNQRSVELNFRTKGCQDRWAWCDALFMAPPAWLRLYLATGDKRCLEFMDQEWQATYDFLYDKEEHLYYRDSTYFEKREANGRKVFWSRGNGWVMGGLVRVLQMLPPEHPRRAFYLENYRQMAAKIATLQQPDGLWRSSLLDPESYPLKETSGSGFYTYALTWGINRGVLDRAQYEPVVRKAWAALTGCVTPEGKLEHVQPIGADPRKFDPTHSDVYGVGAFLLAGSEIYRLALADLPAAAYGNFLPQRKDDWAWENDRVAFRIYGPGLERTGEISSGIDVWAKRTPKPVIEPWYFKADYHKDHGEGLDFYKVGPSRGCGATGVWRDRKLYVANNFTTWRNLENGLTRVSFEVGYAPYDAAGLSVRETRRITLETGSNLNKIETRFDWESGPDQVEVRIGIVKRETQPKASYGAAGRWVTYWDPGVDGSGELGCAVVLPSGGRVTDSKAQAFLETRVKRGGTLVYYAGAGWTRSGQFANSATWEDYVRKFNDSVGAR